MPALNLITGYTTAAGQSTAAALTMASGDSLQIKNAPKAAFLIAAWSHHQTTGGNVNIYSPRFHDAVKGITYFPVVDQVYPMIYPPAIQFLVPQDTLTVKQLGSATAGDIDTTCLLIYYPTLPGSEGRFITYEELVSRRVNTLTVQTTLALGTAGGYSGEVAINSTDDLLKGNIDYAIIGAHSSVLCAAIRWRGPDSGNVGFGMPGIAASKVFGVTWFTDLARATGWPIIPVINAANKGSTFVDGAQNENGADTVVHTIMCQLR